ncbi:HAAS signaling domain-containing protein [Oceanobacillus alkalisoli]|uniref:HAAS signaling domain-containing protein n=1 Tax=Oceanobacillus alkalisoli TaxID=2925113 RepID=UPI001EE4E376|nr:hypothetical protein [Oceanobacillus alkalisoli]MCG5104906.1 hypothetical protein [Oceanobacillus alkalisoli]
MNEEAQRFLHELKKALEEDPHRAEIIAEYRLHVEEMLAEITERDADIYNLLVTRLGSPEELAELWKEEKSVTPKKMQRLFVFLNIALFAGGVLFTIGYNVLGWRWLEILWESLTESTTIIILIYLFFWGLLGYEIGKALGARGKKVLTRTFLIGIIPNLLLMYLIVFRLIPYEWFDPLLDRSFIVLSILCTVALYPVSLLGYHWGRRASV